MDPNNLSSNKKNVSEFFTDRNTPETTPFTHWEAHKCVIRGLLISNVTSRKWAKHAKVDALLTKIQTLEKTHQLTKTKTHSKN